MSWNTSRARDGGDGGRRSGGSCCGNGDGEEGVLWPIGLFRRMYQDIYSSFSIAFSFHHPNNVTFGLLFQGWISRLFIYCDGLFCACRLLMDGKLWDRYGAVCRKVYKLPVGPWRRFPLCKSVYFLIFAI